MKMLGLNPMEQEIVDLTNEISRKSFIFTYWIINQFDKLLDKVNRCLARYSPRATTTNRHTNRAPKKPVWPGPNWPKMPIFGQILFFTGEIKSFVTHIMENPPRHLVPIGFWSGIGQNVQKMAIFGPKWPKLQILDQFWSFWGQNS